MKVSLTAEFVNDLRESRDARFVKQVLDHTVDEKGAFTFGSNDHRFRGIEDAWVRYRRQSLTRICWTCWRRSPLEDSIFVGPIGYVLRPDSNTVSSIHRGDLQQHVVIRRIAPAAVLVGVVTRPNGCRTNIFRSVHAATRAGVQFKCSRTGLLIHVGCNRATASAREIHVESHHPYCQVARITRIAIGVAGIAR